MKEKKFIFKVFGKIIAKAVDIIEKESNNRVNTSQPHDSPQSTADIIYREFKEILYDNLRNYKNANNDNADNENNDNDNNENNADTADDEEHDKCEYQSAKIIPIYPKNY